MKQIIRVKVGPDPELSTWHGEKYLRYQSVSIYPEGDLKGLIATLQAMQAKYRDRFQDMSFDSVRDCGCPNYCSCPPSYVLFGLRYETDLEQKVRLEKEEKLKARKEEQERRSYEELKKKFG